MLVPFRNRVEKMWSLEQAAFIFLTPALTLFRTMLFHTLLPLSKLSLLP